MDVTKLTEIKQRLGFNDRLVKAQVTSCLIFLAISVTQVSASAW